MGEKKGGLPGEGGQLELYLSSGKLKGSGVACKSQSHVEDIGG